MLARIKAKEIGRIGGRLAAVLAGSQFTVAAARVGDHAKLAGDCAGDSAFHLAAALGQTAWSMLDACLVGQVVHGAGAYLMSDSSDSTVQTVAGIIGHEVVGHLVSFVFQVLS